jgi:hypothetical protein
MTNKLNYKIPLTTNKTKASLLTIILLMSLALPLFMFSASAAATVSISTISGPNATAVAVTGSGFGVSEATGAFTITVDGLAGKAFLTGAAPTALTVSKQLATDASGTLTGYFIIGGVGAANLAAGPHSVQISDATSSPPAVTFTITAPSVTVTPSSGPAGTSVLVSATGFPRSVTGVYTVTNTISAASFAGTAITVSGGATTVTATTLSSNVISSGASTGTVSLPGITTGSAFTLTDSLGNVATTTFSLNAPTVTLTPASGPVGTLVTATVTGFGPGATVATVKIGNGVTPSAITPFIPAAPVVTEQGTSAFQFAVIKAPLTADFAAGSRTITVTDSLGNVATSAFTITPSATLTLGAGAVNSGVAYAPTGTLVVQSFLTVTGFKPSTLLTITSSPGVPAGWITFAPAALITTDAFGAIAVTASTGTGTAPASGVYSVTISDGTNSVTVYLTITASANFFVISPISGARGTTVTLTGFLAVPAATTDIIFDGTSLVGETQCSANTWPAVPTPAGSFTVPTGAGTHSVTTTGIAGSATFTTTGAPTISIVNPSTAAVGTTVTVVGSGFANAAGVTLASFTIDSVSVTPTSSAFTSGSMIATFAVPAFLTGAHTISATDSSFNTASASFTTSVSSVAVSPTSGAIGVAAKTISITGSGLPAGQTVAVSFDATILGAITAGLTTTNTNGGIIIYTTSIPATLTYAGAHTITVTAGTASATTTFTVIPLITLAPTAVRSGAVVGITGAGFAASSALSLALNGTATTWYHTGTFANTTTILSDAAGSVAASAAVIISSTTVPQALNITVTDAAGNTASAILTVLATPSITLAATQGIAGVATVGIAGAGFTPGAARVASVSFLSGSTVLFTGIQTATPIVVGAAGTFANTVEGFTVPTVAAGTYTVSLTLTVPTETATASFTILGTPTVTTAVASAKVGANVTLNSIGITTVATATLGGAAANLLATPGTTFGPQTPLATGANAYNLTTWFIVPALPAGSYTLLVADGTRSATTLFAIIPAITALTPTSGLKGDAVTIAGNGFAATSAFTMTFNGAAVTPVVGSGTTTSAAGALPVGGTIFTFLVPVIASANNTVVVTDASGNSATAYLALTVPTIIVIPASGVAGSTVQVIGSGYSATNIFIQVGTAIVPTNPTPIAGASFIAYITIPAGTSAGATTITATDSKNNAASAAFTVTSGGTAPVIDSSTLSSSAQTQTGSGTAQTSFAKGAQVNFGFSLKTTTGSGNVMWRITVQQPDLTVVSMSYSSASVSTTAVSPVSGFALSPTAPAGTYTAQIQIYASDGVTPLAVTNITFTVT